MPVESRSKRRNVPGQGSDTGETGEGHTGPRIGSLFSGAGGLDMAVESVFGGQVVWQSEIDGAASKVLAHRFPGVTNLGDITAIGWDEVPPVDILCGGFPCQDVSAAGKRAGIKDGTRSGLWAVFADAIDALRPQWVVIENVRGLLSAAAHRTEDDAADHLEPGTAVMGNGTSGPVLRAAGAVLGDLADLGYDAQWATVAAADVGAPHRRERVFIVASVADAEGTRRSVRDAAHIWQANREVNAFADDCGIAPDSPRDGRHERRPESAGQQRGFDAAVSGDGHVELLPTPRASDPCGAESRSSEGFRPQLGEVVRTLLPTPNAQDGNWGKYAAAIARWEAIVGPAPAPTEPNRNGKPRLNPAFSEWMMGWPAGWVTDPAIGMISRNDQLRIVGNGVCPQQAVAALRFLVGVAAGTHTHTHHRERADVTPTLLPTPCARDHKDGDGAAAHARHTPSPGAVSAYFNTANESGATE